MEKAKTKTNIKNEKLIQEQNRGLVIICAVLMALIAFVGVASNFYGNTNPAKNNQSNSIEDTGIVDDLGEIRN